MAGVVLWWINVFPDPLAHVRASWLMALSTLTGSPSWLVQCRGLAAFRLRCLCPRRVARLAGDRGWISRLPVVMARVLGAVIFTALARSSVALAVLRRAMVWRRSFSMRLVLAGHDDTVLTSGAAGLSARMHRLLL
jgi:hypothetical protein